MFLRVVEVSLGRCQEGVEGKGKMMYVVGDFQIQSTAILILDTSKAKTCPETKVSSPRT